MRHWIAGVFAAGVAVAMPVAAQTATIDPGMTRAEVIDKLGKPNGERATGSYVYLFYRNNCEVRCGMQDLVILQNDLVVDAIFRSSKRSYSGASSSPTGVTPEASGNGTLRTRDEGSAPTPQRSGSTPAPTPIRSNSSTPAPSRGGVVSGTAAPTGTDAPSTSPRATVTGVGISGPAATNTNRTPSSTATGITGTNARPANGIDNTKVLDNVPPNPRDTSTIQPSRTQGQLTPSAPGQQPIPYSGSKPNPRDSAVRAKTGQPADTVKPPEE